MPAPTLSHRRIAILEDNPTNRDRLAEWVTESGGDALPIEGPAPKLAQLKRFFTTNKVQLVVCDHHLSERSNYAPYYGAQAVAESYRAGIGGILVTAFERDDAELLLRRYRRLIPALLRSPTDLDRANLQAALLQAEQEVKKHKPVRERIPHRTIMTVQEVEVRGSSKLVKVVMSQWDAEQEVRFPLDLIPVKFRSVVKPGNMLIAQVNIEAARQEDLFFDQFELPSDHALKKAKAIFGRP